VSTESLLLDTERALRNSARVVGEKIAENILLKDALSEAMEWDWLTDAELIPADVRARLEALVKEAK
jgi:hypothetical protein